MQHKVKVSHSVVSSSLGPHGLYSPWHPPGQNTGVGSRSILQGVFPTHGSNPGLPHGKQILYPLNHQGSPRILGCVAYPFSSGSSWPRDQTSVSCIAGGFFSSWATREALNLAQINVQLKFKITRLNSVIKFINIALFRTCKNFWFSQDTPI